MVYYKYNINLYMVKFILREHIEKPKKSLQCFLFDMDSPASPCTTNFRTP